MAKNPRGRIRSANLLERTIDDAENDAKAARLRAQRKTYPEIAEIMGCSLSTAYNRVWRAIRSAPVEDGQALRDAELAHLDVLAAKAWEVLVSEHPLVSNGKRFDDLRDAAPVLAAIRELRQLSESRRKLLGLDAPVKHDVKVSDGLDADIERLVAELAGMAGRGQAAVEGPAASRGLPAAPDLA